MAQEPLNQRALSMLKAVRDGRGQVTISREPDLYVDGMSCCDQPTAHLLSRSALIAPARSGRIGERVPAVVTERGLTALAEPGLPIAS
ncbi:hypothetical protein [Amycolatopsis sp. NPDC059657]|uniref:hypothetical protein n=1 Tax=Amycolatopsis sp. NPDC059657 TaxID=3346899 RepID=UPI003671BC4D